MKTYSNFNEMFNAQSGVKSVGVFNYIDEHSDGYNDTWYGIRPGICTGTYGYGVVEVYGLDSGAHRCVKPGRTAIVSLWSYDKALDDNGDVLRCVDNVLSKYGFKAHRDFDWDSKYKRMIVFTNDTFADRFGEERAEKFYPVLVKQIVEELNILATKYEKEKLKLRKKLEAETKREEAKKKREEEALRQRQDDAWNPEWDADFIE